MARPVHVTAVTLTSFAVVAVVAMVTLYWRAPDEEMLHFRSPALRIHERTNMSMPVVHGELQAKLPFFTVVVVTTSVASWVDRRQRIRSQFPRNMRLRKNDRQTALLKFAVGTQGLAESDENTIRREAVLHSDILLLDCLDLDDHLNNSSNWSLNAGPSATTSKVMYAAQWAVRHFDFEYFFRLGDDSYLRIDKFLALIDVHAFPTRNAVVGQIWTHEVFGVVQSFAQGSGYALTHDVCLYIAKNAGILLQTAPEDCVVSRWLYAIGTTFVDSSLWCDLAVQKCEDDVVLVHRLPTDLWPTIADDGSVQF